MSKFRQQLEPRAVPVARVFGYIIFSHKLANKHLAALWKSLTGMKRERKANLLSPQFLPKYTGELQWNWY